MVQNQRYRGQARASKVLAAALTAVMVTAILAACSDKSADQAPPTNTKLSEFDYSLGKSATPAVNHTPGLAPQNYSYGRNRK